MTYSGMLCNEHGLINHENIGFILIVRGITSNPTEVTKWKYSHLCLEVTKRGFS